MEISAFEFAHLKPELQVFSRPFYELVAHLQDVLPPNHPFWQEILHKLFEAKNMVVYGMTKKPK